MSPQLARTEADEQTNGEAEWAEPGSVLTKERQRVSKRLSLISFVFYLQREIGSDVR
jgi:hypothetical protein